MREIAEINRADLRDQVTTTLQAYHGVMSGFGLALFIAVFVSLVFFAATCSLLYFRLFTEVDDDRRYFGRLLRSWAWMRPRRPSRIQNGVVFLVPFAMGLLHSTFAMKALSTLMSRPVLTLGWLVAAAYLVIYGVPFFAVTDGVYQRAVAAERWLRPAPTA